MHKKRRQAYRNLINALLNCNEGEEWQLLEEHSELLDAHFVQTMLEVSEDLRTQDDLDNANFLMNLAGQLMGVYGNTSDAQLKFLWQVLQIIQDSKGNPEVVYPLLQNNLDKLDETFAEKLYQWGIATLPTLKSEQAYRIARDILELSTIIRDFPLGNRTSNLEIALKGYQAILSVVTSNAFPYEWADTQDNLGLAYRDRIKGDKSENIEQAISCFQKSLKVYTHDSFLSEWARTKNNLGTAYCERIKGKKTENLERAISCFEEALKVYSTDAFPRAWAITKMNLGIAYYSRIKGDKSENLETAISCFEESLKVYTIDAFSYEWAKVQMNLGAVYIYRIEGEKAENLETAISCSEEALKVYIIDTFPAEWANTKMNLGAAYTDRIKGEKAENLETAISCFKESLEVYTIDAFPVEWASIKMNLGIAYTERIKGEKANNLETAISCFKESLKVRNSDDFPVEWATTQLNLGNAYQNRLKREKPENIERALACYQESLKVYTPDAFPVDWARTKNNLGVAYQNRLKGEKPENIERALACYQESLKVYTPDALPLECLRTGRNLGNLAFGEGNWQLAIEGYSKAVKAVELSRSWAMTPQSKQEVMEAVIYVYYNIVQASLNTEQIPRALEYVERSKTRNLVELLATRDLKPRGDFSPAIVEELDRLRHQIRTEQIYLANQERKYNTLLSESGQPSQPSLPDRTRLNQLQQELDELIERDISPIDPSFSLTQKVETISFRDIQSLIDERTAIVEWYITGEKILAFIITSGEGGRIPPWQSSPEDLKALLKRTNGYLHLYYRNDNKRWWRKQLESRLQNLAEILHLDEILSRVPPECDRLILIPHRFLHILPLHALPVSPQIVRRAGGEGKYLLDLFPRGVQYAPSCQLLLKIAQSQQRPDFQNLFAIQNPTGDLIYTDLEVETIRSFLPSSKVLARQAATEEAVKNYQNFPSVHCGHFSCHGEFNPISPLESALILADEEHWTLGEIFELSLPQCRLVTLSACETGFTDFNSLSDEYIGLPNGFLFAGSPSIVISLWTVSDLSTALLMVKFYENLPQSPQAGEVAISLKQAQKWLRNLTYQEFEQELTKPQYEKALTQLQQKFSPADFFELEDAIEVEREKLQKFEPDDKPFANPFYWAAFVAIEV